MIEILHRHLYLDDHFAHRSCGHAREGLGELIEGKNAIDERSRVGAAEQG